MSWSRLLALAFPTPCPGCGAPAEGFCAACRPRLAPASVVAPPPGVDWWVAPFAYEGAVRRLIVKAKYRQARAGLTWLAGEIAGALDPCPPVHVVTWVPAHPAQRRQRGFDQGQVLAAGVAAAWGLPMRRLLRRLGGDPQTGSGRAGRAAGPALRAIAPLTGRAVLVVDDVATTGASLAAAAAVLRAAGACQVCAATAARTELEVWQREADFILSPHRARSSAQRAGPTSG